MMDEARPQSALRVEEALSAGEEFFRALFEDADVSIAMIELKDGKIVFFIGDVAGHGIEAARTAVLVKDFVSAFAHRSSPPHEILSQSNDVLIEKRLPVYATVFLGVLDPQTGLLRYSFAGHPAGLLRRVSGDLELLRCGSTPLAVFPRADWKSWEVELRPGDLLLLYTDGVTEARCGSDFFGETRLRACLSEGCASFQDLPRLIADEVVAFSGGELRDDIAVLALLLTHTDSD